jgi:hypothetical protein
MTHADIAWMAECLGVDDSRWCHGTVDTDCLLQVLVEDSLDSNTGSAELAEVFDRLSIDRHRVLEALRQARPAGRSSLMLPESVPSEKGDWVGERRPTGRFVLVAYRVIRAKPGRSDKAATCLEIFHSLLMEDQGPAAEALEAAGVSTRQARHVLGLARRNRSKKKRCGRPLRTHANSPGRMASADPCHGLNLHPHHRAPPQAVSSGPAPADTS